MDIQHSDIGCNKHQAIPAFQPVHLTQLYKKKNKISYKTIISDGQQFVKKMR